MLFCRCLAAAYAVKKNAAGGGDRDPSMSVLCNVHRSNGSQNNKPADLEVALQRFAMHEQSQPQLFGELLTLALDRLLLRGVSECTTHDSKGRDNVWYSNGVEEVHVRVRQGDSPLLCSSSSFVFLFYCAPSRWREIVSVKSRLPCMHSKFQIF